MAGPGITEKTFLSWDYVTVLFLSGASSSMFGGSTLPMALWHLGGLLCWNSVVSSLCTYPPNSRSLSLLGHSKHHNDTLFGPFQGLQSLHLFLFGGRWKRSSINGLLFTTLLPSPGSPMSYGREIISTSMGTGRPIKMEREGMGLWQHLIPWEDLAFLEAKGGVWAHPAPCPRQVQCLILGLAEYPVFCPYWKKKKREQDWNSDDIS